MNQAQVERHVQQMRMLWPNSKHDDAQILLWHTKLRDIKRPDLADGALNHLADNSPYWPHWSEFLTVYKRLLRAETPAWNASSAPALPSVRPDKDYTGEVFGKLRAALKKGRKCSRHEADGVAQMLTDAWGDVPEGWALKFSRMEYDALTEAVGVLLEQYPRTAPWAEGDTAFGIVGREYNRQSDIEAAALWAVAK